MDVALLTETWLRNQKELLNYFAIEVYVMKFCPVSLLEGVVFRHILV